MKISAISNVSSKKTTNNNRTANKNFGSVVPVNVVLDGMQIQNSFKEFVLYQRIAKAFVKMINKPAKNGIFNELTQKYREFDKDFVPGQNKLVSTCAYGSNYDSTRYICSGIQAPQIADLSRQIADAKYEHSSMLPLYTLEAKDVLNDMNNRIKKADGIAGINIIAKQDNGKIKITGFDVIRKNFSPFNSDKPYKRPIECEVDESDIPNFLVPNREITLPQTPTAKPTASKRKPYNDNQLLLPF